jgi:osmoprotectant transport system permease protein
MRVLLLVLIALAALASSAAAPEPPLRVGSKRFTESYILGEIVAQAVRRGGGAATHSPGLGNTAILVQALTQGAIDA